MDAKDVKEKTLGIINAIMTILNKFPVVSTGNSASSLNFSLSPVDFMVDIYKNSVGYGKLIDVLEEFIMVGIEPLEVAIKTYLSVNVKNLINCSLNPFITKELLKYGITFDLKEIDLFNALAYSPLKNDEKWGKFTYFGTDDINPNTPSELKKAKDFNAFLWYVKSFPHERVKWVRSATGKNKEKSIVTLEYSEFPEYLTASDGSPLEGQHLPDRHCLQVFLGNAENVSSDNINKEIEKYEQKIKAADGQKKGIQTKINKCNETIQKLSKSNNRKDALKIDIQKKLLSKYQKELTKIENDIKEYNNHLQDLRNSQRYATKVYPLIYDNYYYRKTLIEFNIDYIWSLKLFDKKVVTAQLIDALSGCLTVDLGLSYEHLLVVNEVKKIVQSVIETDDAEVNDCFFSFDNETYNSLMEQSENQYRNLQTFSDGTATNQILDATSLLEQLNNLSDSSTKEEQRTVISGVLRDISGQITNKTYDDQNNFGFNAQLNFIDNLLNNLSLVLTKIVLSPKVYLLLAVNMKILGKETNLSLEEVLTHFRSLIVGLIRTIRDNLFNFIKDQILAMIKDLTIEIGTKLSIEQVTNYYNILKRCIDCFRFKQQSVGFTIDSVNYADIYPQQQSSPTTC